MNDITIEQFNTLLENIEVYTQYLGNKKTDSKIKLVKRELITDLRINKSQEKEGKEGEEIRIFDVFPNTDYFLKVNIGTNSYVENEFLRSLKIVKKSEKTIKVFEYE